MSDRKKCDVVLEGGITSGAVYPGFVCKLAERYDFHSIGGTSAGAIAAALGAAAQYARNRGKSDAFDEVAKVPGWLGSSSEKGKGTNLFSLFQPSSKTSSLFRLATSFLEKGWKNKLTGALTVLWIEVLIGIFPGAFLAALAWHHFSWHTGIAAVVLSLANTGLCILAAILIGVALRLRKLADHNFGLCTGYAPKTPETPYALVNWLNDQINGIADKQAATPLTFGDLREQQIDLRMMTSCFTWGRPFTMPFESHVFYFCPKVFREYFPEEIVSWMEQHPPKSKHPRDGNIDLKGYLPFPEANDLPIIVATRLSLSFPVLFCAVPLAAVDFSLRRREEGSPDVPTVPGGSIGPEEARIPEPVWFTDGGICNNFPLHLFDAPLPVWPTFGICLEKIRKDRSATDSRVWVPRKNNSAMQPRFERIPESRGFFTPFAQLKCVAGAIIDSARNWVNSLQSVVPGYRDRIVHVYLTKEEGGLNLNMSSKLVTNLGKYGSEAAQLLIDHFIHGLDNGKPTEMTWDNQRWIRYRSTMTLLETFLGAFSRAIAQPQPGDQPYSALVAGGMNGKTHGYPLSQAQIPVAISEMGALQKLGASMTQTILKSGTPQPEPDLVIRPRF